MEEKKNRCLLYEDGEVIFTSTDNAIDVYPDIEDEDAILHYAKCNHCGAEYEIVQYLTTIGETCKGDEIKLRKEYLSNDETN